MAGTWSAATRSRSVARKRRPYYRYFPCPDLVPVTTSPERIEEQRRSLPEFPAQRRSRYRTEFGLSLYDASVIVKSGGRSGSVLRDRRGSMRRCESRLRTGSAGRSA